MSAALALVAASLEMAAGSSTSANPNVSGYWKRIAAAAESLAGASTSANEHAIGYMKRTAVALESIAGTGGAEENQNESGYLKRIVDALEVQAGAVMVGSLWHRLLLSAQNATFSSFDPDLEYSPDPSFDNAAAWTRVRCVVSGGGLQFTGMANPFCVATSAATIEPGTYLATGIIDSVTLAIYLNFGGFGNVTLGVSPGPFSVEIILPSVVNQFLRFATDSGQAGVLSSCSVKRTG
jgi:hypothetical protein